MAREYGLVFNAAEVQKNGKFEVRGVPPGSYVAMAITDDENGVFRTVRQRVDVVSADVEDVRLAPASAGSFADRYLLTIRRHSRTVMSRFMRCSDDDPETDFGAAGDFERVSAASVKRTGASKSKPYHAWQICGRIHERIRKRRSKYFVRSVRLGASAADTGFSSTATRARSTSR